MIKKWFNRIGFDKTLIFISLVGGAFIVYPRIFDLLKELSQQSIRNENIDDILFFIYRYLYFSVLTWILLIVNMRNRTAPFFPNKLVRTAFITAIAYGVYVIISMLSNMHADHYTGFLLFQFIVTFLLCAFTGYIISLYSERHEHEREIAQLKNENLKSRYEALVNQINPHFFFNSLNGLSALVRSNKKQQTIEYINKLSEVFRYILQGDKKGIVELREELEFLDSFRYLQEIRYSDHLKFSINIPEEKKNMRLPALSLLPVINNIVKHNMIDRENKMTVTVRVNDNDELVISNPIHHKLDEGGPHGLGLVNLADRFILLFDKKIRIEKDDDNFAVYLPLT